jgi:hypothetical protein
MRSYSDPVLVLDAWGPRESSIKHAATFTEHFVPRHRASIVNRNRKSLLLHHHHPIHRNPLRHLLLHTGWPVNLHAIRRAHFTQPEIERQRTLREISRFAVMKLRQGLSAGMHLDFGAQSITIRTASHQPTTPIPRRRSFVMRGRINFNPLNSPGSLKPKWIYKEGKL